MHVHERLGISFAEYGALLGTRALLVHHGLEHSPNTSVCPGKHMFNMAVVLKDAGCGTVGCIGGTMALIMDRPAMPYVDMTPNVGLRNLFYPSRKYEYSDITAEQAVQAIDNFIEHGEPRWADVLGPLQLKK